MTVVRITTTTCDACGKNQTGISGDRDGCITPDYKRWASLEWEETPKEGERWNQWKELSLCPEDLGEVLAMIAAKRGKPPVTDAGGTIKAWDTSATASENTTEPGEPGDAPAG